MASKKQRINKLMSIAERALSRAIKLSGREYSDTAYDLERALSELQNADYTLSHE